MREEQEWPRAHLVVDDFFSAAALRTIFAEIATLDGKLAPGLVRALGHDGQSVFFEHERRKNRAVWIHHPSKTLTLFREALWSTDLVAAFDQAREPLFQIIPHCWAPHLQVSKYMTGDHYDFHEDEGAGVNLTAIVFLAVSPKKVKGGDFVIAYDGDEATIPFRNNRLIIFPSKTLHRVTAVEVDSKNVRDARISLQCWLTHGRPAKAPRPRAPEADRPTFLMAEASIITAAQAMIGKREQSPEDLYWGAFYVSRILSSNLQALVPELGPIKIKQGESLEVYGRVGKKRVGFRLGAALHLFVDGKTAVVPLGATEKQTRAILKRLSRELRVAGR